MKIMLFRFEKEKIHILNCEIISGEIVINYKEKISLESTRSKGEKYQKILDELLQIYTNSDANLFLYQSPQKYMGTIKDEEGFANGTILNLFCYQNNLNIIELTTVSVRCMLSILNKEFKLLLEKSKIEVINKYSIAKSDKLIDGFVFLYLLKDKL